MVEPSQELQSRMMYAAHQEALRQQFVNWYVVLVSGLLAFLFRDAFGIDPTGDSLPIRDSSKRGPYIAGLAFLLLLSMLADLFLLIQKKHHTTHMSRVEELAPRRFVHEGILKVFRVQFGIVAMIGAGIAFLLPYVAKWPACWGILMPIFYFGFAVGAYWKIAPDKTFPWIDKTNTQSSQ